MQGVVDALHSKWTLHVSLPSMDEKPWRLIELLLSVQFDSRRLLPGLAFFRQALAWRSLPAPPETGPQTFYHHPLLPPLVDQLHRGGAQFGEIAELRESTHA